MKQTRKIISISFLIFVINFGLVASPKRLISVPGKSHTFLTGNTKQQPWRASSPYAKPLLQTRSKSLNNNKNDWNRAELNTAKDVKYLSDLEKAVIQEMNMVRTAPAKYASLYLTEMKKYFNKRQLEYPGEVIILTQEGVRAVEECIRFLKKAKPVGLLLPSRGMSKAAKDLVKDQSKTGRTGHTGSDKSDPNNRLSRYGEWIKTCGENIEYGNNIARRIVLSLLIDDGVPSRGHRANLMQKNFRVCGIACGTHPEYRYMCVIDYAGGFHENKDGR